jgi:hypothetical protein
LSLFRFTEAEDTGEGETPAKAKAEPGEAP